MLEYLADVCALPTKRFHPVRRSLTNENVHFTFFSLVVFFDKVYIVFAFEMFYFVIDHWIVQNFIKNWTGSCRSSRWLSYHLPIRFWPRLKNRHTSTTYTLLFWQTISKRFLLLPSLHFKYFWKIINNHTTRKLWNHEQEKVKFRQLADSLMTTASAIVKEGTAILAYERVEGELKGLSLHASTDQYYISREVGL